MKKTSSRWMAYAAVANDVFIIAPKRNQYWQQWDSWLVQHGFKTTFHTWCGLGIRDFDSGKPLGHHTRIASKKVISSHGCQCGDVSSHVHELRKDRNDIELDNGDGSPHQKANRDWAAELVEIMELKLGGPIINDAWGSAQRRPL